MSLLETDTIVAPHSETYILQRLLKAQFAKYKIIIIYDFDLAGVTGKQA
jgi:hypothetical protein